ncbi:MAG TPA: outer membrane beta-barrel protein [Longimicrobiaceae bacterium]|nr:outer membrane beta-barrel protein [Longimicrobiaceae bacterium]
MNRVFVIFLGIGTSAAVAASPAHAQSFDSGWNTEAGLAVGGISAPSGGLGGEIVHGEPSGVDVGGGVSTGFTVAGSFGIRKGNSPIGYRLEAQYSRFSLDDDMRFGGGGAPLIADGNASILNGTGNVVLTAPISGRLRPYVIGGLGIYRLSSEINHRTPEGRDLVNGVTPLRSETKFGLNGGAGLEVVVGSLRTFVEARYHGVFTEGDRANVVPITIGVKF